MVTRLWIFLGEISVWDRQKAFLVAKSRFVLDCLGQVESLELQLSNVPTSGFGPVFTAVNRHVIAVQPSDWLLIVFKSPDTNSDELDCKELDRTPKQLTCTKTSGKGFHDHPLIIAQSLFHFDLKLASYWYYLWFIFVISQRNVKPEATYFEQISHG